MVWQLQTSEEAVRTADLGPLLCCHVRIMSSCVAVVAGSDEEVDFEGEEASQGSSVLSASDHDDVAGPSGQAVEQGQAGGFLLREEASRSGEAHQEAAKEKRTGTEALR